MRQEFNHLGQSNPRGLLFVIPPEGKIQDRIDAALNAQSQQVTANFQLSPGADRRIEAHSLQLVNSSGVAQHSQ